ncbi:hypothetical protein BU16DRAFT_561039 [Lophium mytilinum]|uniref:Uncharacterized protein n=1 Tax=Lophium mytilinum TaxID=390894 RepID=A0A6A6QUX2_9PEZI|nr:hypothetical protein BU16DRAFT_561039 [Lophium mytilinum]
MSVYKEVNTPASYINFDQLLRTKSTPPTFYQYHNLSYHSKKIQLRISSQSNTQLQVLPHNQTHNTTKPKTKMSSQNMSAPKNSFDSASTTSLLSASSSEKPTKSTSSAKKIYKAVVQHAKEHHQSVNAAFDTYYGPGLRNGRYAPTTKRA